MKDLYKVASFFAGVGGIDIGFEQTGSCRTVYANELDLYAANTYEMNFPIKVDVRDINEVDAEEIPSIDIMVGGFPCQPFSNAGLKQGFNDEKGRGNLFFELIRIMKAKRSKAILIPEWTRGITTDRENSRAISMISWFLQHCMMILTIPAFINGEDIMCERIRAVSYRHCLPIKAAGA